MMAVTIHRSGKNVLTAGKTVLTRGSLGPFHNDLVQIPNIARAHLSSQQARDLGAELGDPAADRLIRNIDTALKKHFLNVSQAQIKPQASQTA